MPLAWPVVSVPFFSIFFKKALEYSLGLARFKELKALGADGRSVCANIDKPPPSATASGAASPRDSPAAAMSRRPSAVSVDEPRPQPSHESRKGGESEASDYEALAAAAESEPSKASTSKEVKEPSKEWADFDGTAPDIIK